MIDFPIQENHWPRKLEVYGWLSLDRRGCWLIKGNKVRNAKLTKFISANYYVDINGRYFFQNGPQRVFVSIDLAPYIVNVMGNNPLELVTHNGIRVEVIDQAWFDKRMNLFICWDNVIGAINDRDNPYLFEYLVDKNNSRISSKDSIDPWFGSSGHPNAEIFLNHNGRKTKIITTLKMTHLSKLFEANPKPIAKKRT